MSYASPFDKVVVKYMARFGFDVNIVRNITDESEYDVSTGTYLVSEQLIPVRGMLWDLTLQSNGTSNVGKSLIEAGDKQLLIQPPAKSDKYYYSEFVSSDIVPGRDFVRINDDTYKIVTFKEYNPTASDSILWECYIRK